ncbi:ABC transporter permease [Nocardioides sp. MAH-18]|uniref:ABC transporter permease n=1 Tax=Nocardioides agri TaxID=2682843 RepID=A0A6L6Y336_9ACTN|nr:MULTISPECIES: ABC transporter permease [unclassified Nocardioides]MBA2952843.1 ABC transporter permease [Nocardioides sp. CGMCC 1.13656]MVQ52005.1 ABC transporter permease [Nocardioides sp. MAH-18]
MTGWPAFLRLFLRRDRWMLLWWGLGTMLLYVSQAVSVDDLYATQAEFDRAAASMESNAAFIAMAGPARALNTTGGQVFWQASAFGAIVAGLMSMFLIGRHTRAEEEAGRDELLRATAVGRLAPTTAALLNALLANVLLGVLVAGSLVLYGLASADSVATGVGLTLCGWFFTGTALVAAQLVASTRAAYGLAGVVIAASYVLRALGDVGNGVASWLSPIGWYQAMHPFSGLRWWPALLLLVGTLVVVLVARWLFDRRDYGAGVFGARPGPARAPASLTGGLGLAWRLQRAPLVSWTAGMFVLGAVYGSMGRDVQDLIGDSEASQEMFLQGGDDIVQGFYATSMVMLALIVCGFAISSTLRPRSEEDEGRLEVVLATAVPRSRWLAAHVAITVAGTALALLGAGVGLGLAFSLVTGTSDEFWDLSVPLLQYAPAVLVLSGVARLLYGVSPRAMAAAWLPLVLASVVMLFGDLLSIPQWIQDLSPFEHLALVPAQSVDWAAVLGVAAVAALLSVAGQLAFRRRDVH